MSKARQLADLGNVYDDGALSNRNLIINGAMQVAQRGTSFSGLTSGYTLDRWATYQTTAFLNQQQDADAPDGFTQSLKTTVSTASTPSAGDLSRVVYNVEAQDVSRLGYGTADAQTTTLSFWVKSTVTGDYTILVYVGDPNRSIVKGYSINAANTWEYKTITIVGDTAGSGINNDNGNGISFEWNLLAGSTYNTAGAQDTWVTGGGTRASGQTANCGASGATWQITGVQLEVGDTATPFEHRSYGDELARCQRYFQSVYDSAMSAIAAGRGASGGDAVVIAVPIPVALRASPTVASSGAYYVYDHDSRTSGTPSSVTVSNYPTNGSVIALYLSFSGIVCDDDRVNLISSLGATTLTLDAEL